MNVASSSRSTSGWVLVSRSASTCGQSISWAVVIACFLCSSDFGRSLEESRDDLHLSGYDTPDLTNGSDSYTTLVDATATTPSSSPRRTTSFDLRPLRLAPPPGTVPALRASPAPSPARPRSASPTCPDCEAGGHAAASGRGYCQSLISRRAHRG